MPARPRQDGHPYLHGVRRYILENGERFATVVDNDNVPAYYPTCYALWRRGLGLSAETLVADAEDLVHLGLWAVRESIDVIGRLDAGRHLDSSEIRILADACGLTTPALRRGLGGKVSQLRSGGALKARHTVANGRKSRRLTTTACYLDHVARFAESRFSPDDPELARRSSARVTMKETILKHRPKVRSSRVRGIVPAGRLAEVIAFIANGDPRTFWKNEAVALRNWALVHLLATCGLRQGEARQLKPHDFDAMMSALTVERRHDDPEDHRLREPNAKTFDRTIPFGHRLAKIFDEYLLGPGSDAAALSGSPFLLLAHDNCNRGQPIGPGVALSAVRLLGEHLGITGLTPHHLRHGWVQEFARWAITSGLAANEFHRLANFLGGWSYVSQMATEYRADQLTEEAYKAGLKIQETRA